MRSLCTTTKSSAHLLQLEKGHVQQQRSSTTKNSLKKNLFLALLSTWSFIIFLILTNLQTKKIILFQIINEIRHLFICLLASCAFTSMNCPGYFFFFCKVFLYTEDINADAFVADFPCLFFAFYFASVQFSSVTQSCPTLCYPMNRSTPGLPVHHQLPEFTHTHAHRVGDTIQPSHPLSSPSPALNPSQHQGLFQ